MLNSIQSIHFIGIGGVGMCGLAEIMHRQGYQISGSDHQSNPRIDSLQTLGVSIHLDQSGDCLPEVDLVVHSTAIKSDNGEFQTAKRQGYEVISRGKLLAWLFNNTYGIAVAGSHGKTTTSALISKLLYEGCLEPTFVIGGRLNDLACYAYLGSNEYFVAESDESDASFLYLQPKLAVVTNIDSDHLSTYGGDFNCLIESFQQFVDRTDKVVLCIDDPGAKLLVLNPEKVITYGFSPEADFQIVAFKQAGLRSHFVIENKIHHKRHTIDSSLAGEHNALNTTATLVVGQLLGLGDDVLVTMLKTFQGVGRRFQVHGEFDWQGKSILLVDDYGHHPRELEVTLAAARAAWPDRRLFWVYQPHRYSRTALLHEDFVRVLSRVDVLILLPVYSAGEEHRTDGDSASLISAIRPHLSQTTLVEANQLNHQLDGLLETGDVLLLQGAGDIIALVKSIKHALMAERFNEG